ncbi:MAG: 30S ribosomal protein S16 [Rhodospirillaceae bacterium]|nr:MAG: 30S ribosomal protein S16 [Rhodospirillaceae bacterium]
MPVKIRLSRVGAKAQPSYRLVVADSRNPRDGSFIEKVGTYNPRVPHDHKERLVLKDERIKYWLSVGAQPTDRAQRLLAGAGIGAAPKRHDQTKQDKPRAKTVERMKLAEEAAKQAAAEAEKAAAEPAAAG